MGDPDFAAPWDTRDARRERAPGLDVDVDSAERERTCSRCGAQGTWVHGDDEGAVCDVCLALPVGHVATAQPERCTHCGVLLLPTERTRDRGMCHRCWAQEKASQAVVDRPAAHARPQEEPPPCLLCRRPAVLVPLRVAVRHVDLCLCPEHSERLRRDFGSWLADWIGGDSALLGQMLQGPPPWRNEAHKEDAAHDV